MPIEFQFEPEKAVEAILYVSSRADTDKYATLKLLYLADKLHLERYGRFIFGDKYRALKKGPAPDGAYDIIEAVAGRKPGYNIAPSAKEAFRVGSDESQHDIVPLREPNIDLLSESDVECLDVVVAKVRDTSKAMRWWKVWPEVHDKAWKTTERNRIMDVKEIVRMFPDSEDLLTYLDHR